jgi:NAD(P)-dependent dehydrogenase (short-subunit alcohol dehydrogenase family)
MLEGSMEASGIAWVTGASRGIGRATALELALRGFRVVASMRDVEAGRSLAREAAERGGELELARLDVTSPGGFAAPEGLRVLVNNAGIDPGNDAAEFTAPDEWRAAFETNLFAAVELIRRALPALRAAGGGVICNVTSASLLVPMPFFSVYRASKAALSAYGESLRSECAPHGIRVVEVLPGAIDTDMLAASSIRPAAADHAAYRAQAERIETQRAAAASARTPAVEAARSIVDAILDDAAPLRVACDAMGAALLARWRGQSDEAHMAPLVAAFDPRNRT